MSKYIVQNFNTNEYYPFEDYPDFFDGDWKKKTPFTDEKYIDLNCQRIYDSQVVNEHMFYGYDLCAAGMIVGLYYDKDKVSVEKVDAFENKLRQSQDVCSLARHPLILASGPYVDLAIVSHCLAKNNCDSERFLEARKRLWESEIPMPIAQIEFLVDENISEHIQDIEGKQEILEELRRFLRGDIKDIPQMLDLCAFAGLDEHINSGNHAILDVVKEAIGNPQNGYLLATLVADRLQQKIATGSELEAGIGMACGM